MSEESRVPSQWRRAPQRYGKITNEQQRQIDQAAERFTIIAYIGCGAGAIAALTAAAIAWADVVVSAIGAHW